MYLILGRNVSRKGSEEMKTAYGIIVRDKEGCLLLNQSFNSDCSIDVIKETWPHEPEERVRFETVYSNCNSNGKIELNAEIDGVDEATEKAARLVETLKEAKSLADDLASMETKINLYE